ncbi:uncharacterized protein LOC142981080 [Anticarsia gemmatalis]|uniref:uncharacterized protein LOC142981080 n=1 Tax=Anticarsia gemmatalis TaxID=129554 RepID=UPI003F76EB7E
MPPRIRTRASKALKENIGAENNLKPAKSNGKAPRKALADKTNSASDDTSLEVPAKKTVTKSSNVKSKLSAKANNDVRPRRDRRLPTRFVENPVLISLTSSKDSVHSTPTNTSTKQKSVNISNKKDTPVKNTEVSPFKTPSKSESSLVVSRPRRICRLPSKFDDHSISPNKYIPIQPANASTPIQSKSKALPIVNVRNPIQQNKAKAPQVNKQKGNKENNQSIEKPSNVRPARSAKTAALKKKISNNSSTEKSSPDTNNNPKAALKAQPVVVLTRAVLPKPVSQSAKKFFNRTASPQSSPTKKVSPKPTKKIPDKNLSFKVPGGKKRSKDGDNNELDIYEFTFDPNEEPQPQKKKRKRPVVKKPKAPKPKTAVPHRSAYDQNISKALSALKKVVKPAKAVEPQLPQIQEINDEVPVTSTHNNITATTIANANHVATFNDTGKGSVHECNYPSIRVEDIAADIEPSMDLHDDINYSPVNSPRPKPALHTELDPRRSPERVPNNDPLNLQQDLSFFDDVPVASSSMNVSVRHPLASPWRVEFGSLPIKWPVNTYVKANMTPAVESSFICSEDSTKKKHVYTNMVPEANESLPQIVHTPTLKQTSIISFIKEVAERKAKKKRGRSVSPTKATAMFDNVDVNVAFNKQPENAELPPNISEEVSNNDASNDKENSKEERKTRKRKNDGAISDRPAKSPRKQKDKDRTYFGFDESESIDQENVSPVKEKAKGRSLRPRSRVILQELNGPVRADLPLAAKSKVATSSEAVNRVYEELKSAADAPVFPEKNVENNATNIEDALFNDDSQSVHLFEDIEVVHHLKPTRKSYGKAKKVTFRQRSTSDSDTQEGIVHNNDTSFEDDLADLTFEVKMQEKKKAKKKKPKKLMTKKEEKEAEEWAAGFNSMCEEIEEFPLVVE